MPEWKWAAKTMPEDVFYLTKHIDEVVGEINKENNRIHDSKTEDIQKRLVEKYSELKPMIETCFTSLNTFKEAARDAGAKWINLYDEVDRIEKAKIAASEKTVTGGSRKSRRKSRRIHKSRKR
jgi:hypothetical protein